MAKFLTIGSISKATGCKVQTIRYYEQIGLLPIAPRSAGNQRIYEQNDLDRLMFIRHARDLGFPLTSVRELLSLSQTPDQSCESADKIAKSQLKDIEHRIRRLNALKIEMKRMIKECRGGTIGDCGVIEVLKNHELCHADKHSK